MIYKVKFYHKKTLDMGDEAPLDLSVAVNPYKTHSDGILLVLYSLYCKH